MTDIKNFRITFLNHLIENMLTEIKSLDLSYRIDTEDGPEYEELPTEDAQWIIQNGTLLAAEDLADPTEMISDRYPCSLYSFEVPEPSKYAAYQDKDYNKVVIILVRAWSVFDFMRDWVKIDPVDD
ncbi:hypothetical protein [Bifidobacterium callitrichidarum]|uniref:Uncharacterized protein n=1 Tax=Bifidobacterium callitrichidarum TaxID=2052941 RepID=A0A2U2MYK4_9BIFI|nr:hypothetical protein [Bifidobacterium callitrichidarum]PWG62081.1 hypothetical protein DF196_12705 [Bifidobacterium callitrichidarum]